jgi:uncharacterized Zn finger protein
MGTSDPAEPAPGGEPPGRPGALGSGVLFCENCGKETPHRLLRVKPASGASPTHVTGTARCRVCRWTHPFTSTREAAVEVALIVSELGRSDRRRIALPGRRVVRVGETVAEAEVPLRITRIEVGPGRSASSSPVSGVRTLWAVRADETIVPVSVVQGARTSPHLLRVPPSSRLEVGALITVDGERVVIVGLRARGRTWRIVGDAFAASEVQRAYGRRMLRPPAGRRDWRTDRAIPVPRASSTSAPARSRSSPGVRRNATLPRAPTADGGAATHRSSPS